MILEFQNNENLASSDSESSKSDMSPTSSSEKLRGRGDPDQNVEVQARQDFIPNISIFQMRVSNRRNADLYDMNTYKEEFQTEESESDSYASQEMKNDEESVAREPLLNGASNNSQYENVPYPRQARFPEIVVATDNFNEANILGEGGFGIVYKAVWMDNPAAIKRLNPKIDDKERARKIAEEQARTEFNVLKRCDGCDQILRLYAISLERDPCIVYQLMVNGTLEDRLLCRNDSPALTWSQRVDIAVSIAKGLFYLHITLAKPIVHGDIKSANILLDENMQPKIGDFGLAMELPSRDETCVKVKNPRGTTCYLPEEYLRDKKLSPQLDIYSFGIVLFEIATGMRPIDSKSKIHLTKKLVACEQNGRGDLVRDDKAGEAGRLWFGNLLRIGRACSNREMEKRPANEKVLKLFEEAKTIISHGSGRSPPAQILPTRAEVILDQFRNFTSQTSLSETDIDEIERLERETLCQEDYCLQWVKRSLGPRTDERIRIIANLLELAQSLISSFRQERAELMIDWPSTRKYAERVDHLLNLAENLLLSLRKERQNLLPAIRKSLAEDGMALSKCEEWLFSIRVERTRLLQDWPRSLEYAEPVADTLQLLQLSIRKARENSLPAIPEFLKENGNENCLEDWLEDQRLEDQRSMLQTIRQEIKRKLSLAQELLSTVRQEFAGLLPERLHTENLASTDSDLWPTRWSELNMDEILRRRGDSDQNVEVQARKLPKFLSAPDSKDADFTENLASSDSDLWLTHWSELNVDEILRRRGDSHQNVEESLSLLLSFLEKTAPDSKDVDFTANLASSDSKSSKSDMSSTSLGESEATINVKLRGKRDSDQNVEEEA